MNLPKKFVPEEKDLVRVCLENLAKFEDGTYRAYILLRQGKDYRPSNEFQRLFKTSC